MSLYDLKIAKDYLQNIQSLVDCKGNVDDLEDMQTIVGLYQQIYDRFESRAAEAYEKETGFAYFDNE